MSTFQVGLRSINIEGREQGKRFGVEQFEMRTFSRDREYLENLVSLSLSLFLSSILPTLFGFCLNFYAPHLTRYIHFSLCLYTNI